MKMGLEVLLGNKKWIKELKSKRVGLVCHPASVDDQLHHSIDLLHPQIGLQVAFGPQHGVKGEKQDNMVESEDFIDPRLRIPIYSLYGRVRRPTPVMMKDLDVILFDLQDLGCRIYTFITTLLYIMEAAAEGGAEVWILDRPNPAGREVEGLLLQKGHESFVGAAPIPMRHGLTVGELALYYKKHFSLDLKLKVIPMKGYRPDSAAGWGWPKDRIWVNPSPNASTLNMARIYPGSVLLEGTTMSEGRGTTRALEQVGAPDLDFRKLLDEMEKMAPQWMRGAVFRECYFQPTFHKHVGQLCHGFQIHTDGPQYLHKKFKPYRLMALLFKAIKTLEPKYPLFRDFPYEYTENRLAFDVIAGTEQLRLWIENPKSKVKDLETLLVTDETSWKKTRQEFLIY